MEKEKRLRRREDFRRVLDSGRGFADRYMVIKNTPGPVEKSRIGIVTSKKVGGAVERNIVRRRLREILRHIDLQPGRDLVVIARQAASTATFNELSASVRKLLGRTGLLSTEDEKSGSLVN
ncbi:ribonuclease P protein component [Dehalogenimonas sp. THU2]|uniref:ribonuclease P protein component n=1 Tax=Dehalogenimonas sp. THU2 TaxID=3151121 RepID=UPI0032187E2A